MDNLENHNPEKLLSPGDGFRFLTREEYQWAIRNGMPQPHLLEGVQLFKPADKKWVDRSPSNRKSPFQACRTYRVRIADKPKPSRWPRWDKLCYETKP